MAFPSDIVSFSALDRSLPGWPGPDLAKATHLDTDQDGLEWIDIVPEGNHRVYPKVLIERLASGFAEIYWGDVN